MSPPQVAFAIGRATGNAVTRNRLRRRLRAILRSSPELPTGLMLIGAGRPAVELTFDELTIKTQRLLRAIERSR